MKYPLTHTAKGVRLLGALLALSVLLPLAGAEASDAFPLVTADERARELQYEATHPDQGPAEGSHSRAAVPVIRILSPRADGPAVASPLHIAVDFETTPDAKIVPSSFRVLYGRLKIDLTRRFLDHASVSAAGVRTDADVVPGKYRLFVQIADDQGRTAEAELAFQVGS